MHPLIHRVIGILSLSFFLVSVIAPVSPARAASGCATPTDRAELEAFLDGVISSQMKENPVPGVVLTVVKDGAVFLEKGYGYADLETHTPVDPERTLFRIGSVSKLFVWTAVMQLAEQKKLNLDADINIYLDFEIPATYPEPITLKHLLSHTSGFENINQDINALQPGDLRSLGDYLKGNRPARVFAPGKIIAYSNYGAALAAYIVERVSGLSFDVYAEKNLFAPLEMEHSTFRQPLPDPLSANLASGYNFLDGAYQKGDLELIQAYPAGSMSATASDMAHFMIAYLQNGLYGGKRIIQESTAVQMQQPLFTHDSRLGSMAYGFFENTVNGQEMVWHGGDTIFFHTGLFLFPQQNLALFVSTNSLDGENVIAAVMKAFPLYFNPASAARAPAPQADFKQQIAPYLGEYISARNNFTTIEKVFALFDPLELGIHESGDVLLTIYGEQHRYISVEPGLFQERDQPENQMIYRTNADGQRYLSLTNRPFDYIQAPWYGNANLGQLVLLLVLVLFLIALCRWTVGFLKSPRQTRAQPLLARLAHWAAGLFGLLFIGLLVCLALVLLDNVPVYEMPRFLFVGQARMLLAFIQFLTIILTATGLVLPAFTLLVWIKRYWNTGGRIFYTLLTLLALVGVWLCHYWNI